MKFFGHIGKVLSSIGVLLLLLNLFTVTENSASDAPNPVSWPISESESALTWQECATPPAHLVRSPGALHRLVNTHPARRVSDFWSKPETPAPILKIVPFFGFTPELFTITIPEEYTPAAPVRAGPTADFVVI